MGVDHHVRQVGHGAVRGRVKVGGLDARPRSADPTAVQQVALTKRDWATRMKRVWGFDALSCTR